MGWSIPQQTFMLPRCGCILVHLVLPFLVNNVIRLWQLLDLHSYCLLAFWPCFFPLFLRFLKPWFPIHFAIQLHCYNLGWLLEQVRIRPFVWNRHNFFFLNNKINWNNFTPKTEIFFVLFIAFVLIWAWSSYSYQKPMDMIVIKIHTFFHSFSLLDMT